MLDAPCSMHPVGPDRCSIGERRGSTRCRRRVQFDTPRPRLKAPRSTVRFMDTSDPRPSLPVYSVRTGPSPDAHVGAPAVFDQPENDPSCPLDSDVAELRTRVEAAERRLTSAVAVHSVLLR